MRIFNTGWYIKSSFPFLEWKPTPPNRCCGNIKPYLQQKELQKDIENLRKMTTAIDKLMSTIEEHKK